MRIVFVTGMSGAGKSTALDVLEDHGYYCVDNMPISLIMKFVELMAGQQNEYSDIAIGINIRSNRIINETLDVFDELQKKGYLGKIVFLDAGDDILVKRYKETRRSHPLAKEERVDKGIFRERELLSVLKNRADYIIDTSTMLTRELKQEIEKVLINGESYNNLFVTVLSFGFKYGIPADADLVFDVRFLPNPYYVESLKHLTGNDEAVQKFVMDSEKSVEFLDKLTDMVTFLLPQYVAEGKNSLVIAIGCTGGKHRSVTLANALTDKLRKTEYGCKVEHRDINKK